MPKNKQPKVDEIKETVQTVAQEEPTVEVDESFEPWTVDIRERFGDNVTLGDILTVQNELKDQGKRLVHLYIKDPQVDSVKKVAPKDVEITVA